MLGAALVAPALASAQTIVTHPGGVEIIISTPEATAAPRPAPTTRRVPRRRAAVAAAALPAIAALAAPQGADALVRTALALVGAPYVWGGASPGGFDCSGFTWYVYGRLGIAIPRTADVQFAAGRAVAGYPAPGDLVFFQTYDYGASHVGIYLGGGRFVNAISGDVHVASFASPYFRSRYIGARRFLPG